MQSSTDSPLNWKTTLLFLTFATLLSWLSGWLTMSGALSIKVTIDYSISELNFIRCWVKLAAFIGILIPSIAFLVWFRYPQSRKVLGFYLLVLIIQIVTEQCLSNILFPSIVVIIGTVYTAFRLWQLWQGQQLIRENLRFGLGNQKILVSLLWIMLLFWLSNLVMLLILPWPKVL